MLKQIAAPKAIVKTTKYVCPTTIASGNLFTVLQRGIGSFVLVLNFSWSSDNNLNISARCVLGTSCRNATMLHCGSGPND